MGAFARAVACAVRLGREQCFCHFFMVRMGCSQGAVLVVSYRFGSVVLLPVLLGLRVLYLPGRHLRGHRVAHPAAQRQQGDQEGEEQVTHE
jgi:hypothetical protein